MTPRPCRSTRPFSSRRFGDLVPVALRALDRGGTLAIAGIHLSDIPPLHYDTELFEERQVRSVTAEHVPLTARNSSRSWRVSRFDRW